MSDATSSVGDGTTRISATGGPAGDLACETAEERHSTGSVDTEPLLSYLRLSVMAILESPNRRATFSEICAYIENNCPYYGHEEGWQESLGISLSRNKSFVNVPQEGNDDRGDCWMLDMQYEDTHYDILRRPPLRGGSAAESTPTVSDSTGPAGTRRLCGVRDAGLSVRSRLLRLLALRTAAAVGSGSVGAVGGAAGCERRNSTAATPTCPSVVSANASVDGSGVTAGSAEDGGQLSGASGTADAKLPVCYEELIATAIAELPHRRTTASEISAYLSRYFPHFELSEKTWQKLVYHKLSSSKYFTKVRLKGGGLIRRYCWRLAEKYKDAFRNGSFGNRRLSARPQSGSGADNSPASTAGDLAGGRAVSTPASWEHRNSSIGPTSAGRSVSEDGSASWAAPDSSHPGVSHSEDGIPASDVTDVTGAPNPASGGFAGSIDSVTGTTVEGTAVGIAAGGENGERQLRETGTGSTADTRPKLSYKALITMAITQSPHRRATLSEICTYLTRRFPYFRQRRRVWGHSVSCTLCSSRCFVKVPREDGRGNYWTLDPQYKATFKSSKFRPSRCSKRPLRKAHTVPRGGGTADHPRDAQQQRQQLPRGATAAAATTTTTSTTRGSGVSDRDRQTARASQPPDCDGYESSTTTTTTTGLTIPKAGGPYTKPPFCYAELIAMALAHSPHRRATVSEIFAFVKSRFPYYKVSKKGWQKALQNKLSSRRWFTKVVRQGGERTPYWQLDPKYEHLFEGGNYRHRVLRHGRRRQNGAVSESGGPPDAGPPDLRAAAMADDDNGGGGDSLPLPSYLHCVKYELGSPESPEGNGSDSFDESNFQNATHDVAMTQPEDSTGLLSYCVPAPEPATREKDAFADVPLSICDVRSIKMEVFEDSVAPSGLSSCIKQEPDLELGSYGAENRLAATQGDTPDVTSTAAVTSQCLSVSDVGGPALDSSHPGGSCYEDDVPATDVSTSVGDAETPAYASGAASGSVGGGNGNTTSVPAGVTDEECSLGGGGSTDVVDTRPLLTYKALVAQAIEESPHRKLTMPEIYCYLIGRFPYFEKKKKSFRGTIRCTLSTNKCFLKVPQEGSCFNYWMLDPNYEKTASYRRRHHRERERPFHEGLGVGVVAASPPRSRRGSTEPAATDSSHPGDYCSEVDIRPPGRKTPADDATAATSPYGGRAERRIGVTGNVEAATPVGRAAAAVDEGESCGRGGPASTARSKLPFSYEELIAVAILESPHRTATLSEIKAYITSCFPYFECMKENLQNAIHSTLYFSKYFIKALPEGERRNCWTLVTDPKYIDTFESGKFEQHQIGKQPLSRALGVTTSSDEQQRRLSLPAQPRLPAALREHGSTTLTSTRLSYSNGRAAPDSSCRGSAYCKGETSESNLTSVTGDAGSQTFASCGSASSISAGTVSSEGIAGSDSAANTQLQLTRKQLITQAIMKSPHRKATLSEIYAYISSRYPSFRQRRTFHLRKISSKLSCSPCFVKVRQEGGSRGCWWTLGTKSTGAAATATSPSGGPDSRRSGAREGAAAKTKPPFSYEELIAMAILDSLHRRATVSEIIAYIARRFPYFERSNRSWQKSINCTLTFGKYFVKVPLRGVDIKGRCLNHWMLGPKYKEAVKTGKFRQLQGSRRPVRRPLVELPVAVPPSGAATVCRAGPPAAVDEHSFDPRTSDSYHLGKGRCRDDIWASDVKSTAAAATSSGRSGNSCISVTDNVREGSRVGSGGARTGEGAPCGGCGSAGVKPPFSYEQLIALAIEDSTHRRATLAEIVAYISRRFPYFERGNKSWQKSINCKLSFSKYFVKVPLQGGNIRSRCYNYWMLDPKYKNKIKKGNDNLGHLQCTKRPFGEAVGEAAVAAGCGQQQRDGGSVTGPTSASRSVSEGGSTGRASPDSPHPRGGPCEDDTPASDTTTRTGDAGARACRVGVATGEEDGQCGAGSRPPLSHKALIAMAIAQAPHRRASRSEIYAYITRRFPYFRQKRKLWLNVIGTTLSTGKWFVKGGSSSSKGYYWTLDPQHEDMYKNGSFRRNRRSELPFRAAPDRSPLGPPSLHTAAAAGEPDATDGSRDTAGGALSSSDYPHYGECDESIANTVPNSPRLSDSEVGSSGHVPPDLSVPDSSHYEGDATVTSVTAASGDATTPAAALAGTADNYSDGTDPDSEGTATDGAADGVGEELRSGEAGPADSKPPFNYTQLCMMALEHSPHRRATWSQIAAYITRRFPYFEQKQGWQKCVGNTLTRHQFFINVKQKGARGNNSYWMLDPQYENTYKNINFRQNRHWKQPLREASEVPRSGLEPSSLRVAPAATDLGVCDVALPSSTYTQNGRYRESGISPTSRRLSISEVGNSGQVAPSPSDPVSGHYEDDTAATDVTAALGDASAHAGTTDSCSDGRGTAPGSGTNPKPPFNYAELCTVALEHSPHRPSLQGDGGES